MPTATINLTVQSSSFAINTSATPAAPYTNIGTTAFAVDGQGHNQDANGKVEIVTEGGESFIKVKSPGNGVGPGMNLILQILSDSTTVTFTPLAVVFVGKAPPSSDISGAIGTNSITVVDSGSTTRPQWEYYIQIQKGSDTTQVGWIDPGIENSDEQ